MENVSADVATLDYRAFAFVMTLAAVINGLGIVRWLTEFADYLRQKKSLDVNHYWVFTLAAVFQFLLHILLWWTLWSVRESDSINFLTYLYLLIGPVFLYLGTSLLAPKFDVKGIDLRVHLLAARRPYSTILGLLWVWAIFASLIFLGHFTSTLPLLVLFLAAALAQRISAKPAVLSAAIVLNWLVLIAFVGLYAISLGAVGAH